MALYSYELQIENYKEELLKTIEKNNVTIIKGPTGCGKSTFVPFLFKNKKVAIIEPRRIAVITLFKILSEKINNIGYRMRFNKKYNEKTTMTIFTDGAFLNNINNLDYDYIIIDEVHERSVRTDIILSILKTTYKKKLLLMSATLDTSKLKDFFKAAVYEIPGQGHPIEIKHLESPTPDYIVESYFTIKNILKNREQSEKKDILVFLPGEEDINDLYKLCKKLPSVVTYKVHSTMNDKDQLKIYESSELTRVILSTNICETSLTIPNIKYVIDTGLCKNKIFSGISFLGIQQVSRESAIQRAGRCNRLGPGVCYRLFSECEKFFQSKPEILSSDLTTVILSIINMQKNIFTFEFIDYPPVENILAGLNFLLEKNCIAVFYKNEKCESIEALEKSLETRIDFISIESVIKNITFKVTNYGRKLVFHPFDAQMAHLYEQSIAANLGYFGSIITSLISQENYNFLNAQAQKTTDIEYLISLFEEYLSVEDKYEFCDKKNIPFKGIENALRVFKSLNHTKEGDLESFSRLFSHCFSHNMCTREVDGSYVFHKLNKKIFIHPKSGFFKRKDKKIVIVDVFCTTKAYARIVGKYYDK